MPSGGHVQTMPSGRATIPPSHHCWGLKTSRQSEGRTLEPTGTAGLLAALRSTAGSCLGRFIDLPCFFSPLATARSKLMPYGARPLIEREQALDPTKPCDIRSVGKDGGNSGKQRRNHIQYSRWPHLGPRRNGSSLGGVVAIDS